MLLKTPPQTQTLSLPESLPAPLPHPGRGHTAVQSYFLAPRPGLICPDLPLWLTGGGSDLAHPGGREPQRFAHPRSSTETRGEHTKAVVAPQCEVAPFLFPCSPGCWSLPLHG